MQSLFSIISFLSASGVSQSMDTETPIAERLALGGEVMLLGLGTVFAVLLILWGVLVLFRIVFYTIPNKRKAEADAKQQALNEADYAADAETELSYDEPEEADAVVDDGEIVAAITAAITAYRAAQESEAVADAQSPRFRVVSFRKIG